MRYVRFLKTPRVAAGKGGSSKQVQLLISITSDLGDSFLPDDIHLSAELITASPSEQILVCRSAHWVNGMRSLPIVLPLLDSHAHLSLRVRVGAKPKSVSDDYCELCMDGHHPAVVSVWSADFTTTTRAANIAERRFMLPNKPMIRIWEEVGESISRHLWDAGIAFSCHLKDILDRKSDLSKALLSPNNKTPFHVLELGSGCGIVGIVLAQLAEETNVLLTDLSDAQEIVWQNVKQAELARDSSLRFQVLDWDDDSWVAPWSPQAPLDLILAADCTYNPDSSPALVDTLARLAQTSPRVRVGIAMKMRHSSEEVFFDLMARASFNKIKTFVYPLPGDYETGEELVFLHVYQIQAALQ